MSKITDAIGDILAPLVKLVVKQLLDIVLPKIKEADPKAYKVVITSLYGPIDVYLEDFVETTPTEIDDALVSALLEGLEDAAARDGIELPNLDDD